MNISNLHKSQCRRWSSAKNWHMNYGNQEIEQEHLLHSLLTIEDSLILKIS